MKQFTSLEIWFDGNFVTKADDHGADALFRRWVQLPALAVFCFDDGSKEAVNLETM